MNQSKGIRVFLSIMVILAAGLISFGGCASSAEGTVSIPEFEMPGPPPVEITVGELYEEYMTDETAANAKYEGKRLLFTNVEVEEIKAILPDSAQDPIIYIVNGSVEFRPRYWIDTVLVREGFVVDIIGEVRGVFGLEQHYLIVGDCWVNIVEGDTGAVGTYENPAY